MCDFIEAWRGKCDNEPCEDHKDLKCRSCGEPATHECDETNGLVCGVPLCNNCEHEISLNGTCSSYNHVKRVDQKNLPWYHPEFVEQSSKTVLQTKRLCLYDAKHDRILTQREVSYDEATFKDIVAFLNLHGITDRYGELVLCESFRCHSDSETGESSVEFLGRV